MHRALKLLPATVVAFLLLAPAALAFDGGEGTYGPANDKVVTNAGFIVIAFFPLLVFTLSTLQRRLEKRKQARKAAREAQLGAAQWRGGW